MKEEDIERRISLLQMFRCCGNHDLRQMIQVVENIVKNIEIYQTSKHFTSMKKYVEDRLSITFSLVTNGLLINKDILLKIIDFYFSR